MQPLVSIVIPVRDDAGPLISLLAQLEGGALVAPHGEVEIIVSTAGDDDPAIAALCRQRSDVIWVTGPAGRATQLNAGAARATGEWLWFLHADSTVPAGWLDAFRNLDAIGDRRPETDDRRPETGDRRPATGDR